MRAAVYRAFGGRVEIETVPDPEPPADGVVVAVRATGVCRSDWHGWMGHDPAISLPHVPGHELAGVVATTGPEVRGFAPGDPVTVPFCCGCGRCEPCRHGWTQICDADFQPGFTAPGSFAELVALPRADLNLVRLPDSLPFVEAASLGCRPSRRSTSTPRRSSWRARSAQPRASTPATAIPPKPSSRRPAAAPTSRSRWTA